MRIIKPDFFKNGNLKVNTNSKINVKDGCSTMVLKVGLGWAVSYREHLPALKNFMWDTSSALMGVSMTGQATNGLSPCLKTPSPNVPAGPTRRVTDRECRVVKRVKYYRHGRPQIFP